MPTKREYTSSDDLYKRLYGYYPTKNGSALERLADVAFAIIEDKNVLYDIQKRSIKSKTVYQIDGIIESENSSEMVEAKDYSSRKSNNKVGRHDIQVLEGALRDFNFEKGRFVSSTGYSSRAKKYAEAMSESDEDSSIDLFTIRPSTKEDEAHRIKIIPVSISSHELNFEKGRYKPVFSQQTINQILGEHKDQIQVRAIFQNFYNSVGEIIDTFLNFTTSLNGDLDWSMKNGSILKGTKTFPKGTYIELENMGKYEFSAIDYEIPVLVTNIYFCVKADGEPVLFISSEDGKVNTLITDKELRGYDFVNNRVVKNEPLP